MSIFKLLDSMTHYIFTENVYAESKYEFKNNVFHTQLRMHVRVIHAERFCTLTHIMLYKLPSIILKFIVYIQFFTLNLNMNFKTVYCIRM